MICRGGAEGGDLAWQILYAMVNTLGVDGISSDETDGEEHSVRAKEWRSAQVRDLLVYIDDNRSKTNSYGNPRPGTRPRVRVRRRNPPSSRNVPIAGLPKNYYHQAWYDSLTIVQQEQLGPIAEIPLPFISP